MSAIAVVRISGPNAKDVLFQMGNFKNLPTPRKALFRNICDPENNEVLDKSLILWFPSPNSSTGEDVCELHLHGGISVIRTVLRALAKLPTFCHAEPGEFTKRSFIAGKLDLTEVEGLADLIHAETEAQQRQALRQMEGVLSNLYTGWTDRIKGCLANVEAYIDFSEDQNLENDVLNIVKKDVIGLEQEMKLHLADNHRGEKLRNGIFAVLVGKPNVGKSSLLNAICKRDIAIVSPSAGTTRDVIESSINLGGYLVQLSDTAGIRKSKDTVELEGVRRAYKKSSEADILIFLVDAKTAVGVSKFCKAYNMNFVKHLLCQELGEDFVKNFSFSNDISQEKEMTSTYNHKTDVILILNKTDLLSEAELSEVKMLEIENKAVCPISCLLGIGMKKFLSVFTEKVKSMCFFTGEEPTLTQERHRKYVENCLEYLNQYRENCGYDIVIAAEQLRNAANQLGKITGKITTDDILNIIFKNFCIGK